MRCPFLKEIRARTCGQAGCRMLIPVLPGAVRDEKCSAPGFDACEVYRRAFPEPAAGERCPLLVSLDMQYCAAAPARSMVPHREDGACLRDGHRYCDLYLEVAGPEWRDRTAEIRGIRTPAWLAYTPNHMWLDCTADGYCRIGADDFLAQILGQVEEVAFLSAAGARQPSALITVEGVALELALSGPLLVTACNPYLRVNPERLTAAPYGLGWLFEAQCTQAETAALASGLIRGADAAGWIEAELARLARFTRARLGGAGLPPGELAGCLDRAGWLALFHEFFSPFASWKGQS